jgi:hypothetical protein
MVEFRGRTRATTLGSGVKDDAEFIAELISAFDEDASRPKDVRDHEAQPSQTAYMESRGRA